MFSSWSSSDSSSTPRGGSGAQSDSDVSLTTLLDTPTLRKDLVLVVALAADTMRRNLLLNLEVGPPPTSVSAADSLISFDDPRSDTAQRAKWERRQREMELAAPSMHALKRAAVTHFDAWRVSVLRRLGDVLSVRPAAIQAARKDAIAKAEQEIRERRDKVFWEWADGENVEEGWDREEETSKPWVHSIETPLVRQNERKRVLIMKCLVLLLLSLEHYTAHSRVLLQYVTLSLGLEEKVLSQHEAAAARVLLDTAVSQMSADDATKKKAAEDAAARRWKVGLATVAGAALIGVTGGLAAPILAAGAGAIMHGIGLGALATLLGPLATNFFLVGGLFGAFGGSMTGKVMEKYAKEVKDFKFLPVHGPNPVQSPSEELSGAFSASDLQAAKQSHQLRVTIGISGILKVESEILSPWAVLDSNITEAFALRYEPEVLTRLGTTLNGFLASYALDVAGFTILRHTLLASIAAGLWPIAMIRAAMAMDNPFAMAKARSDKAGKVLAQALMDKVQGKRPVTLIGFSLGARVIYTCLLELAEQNAFGLVEQVILIGGAVPADEMPWRRVRTVVTGRVVNVYSEEDWVLGVLYRTSALQVGVAGLQPVKGVEGVENLNVVEMVKRMGGHAGYVNIVGQILDKAGYPDLDHDEMTHEVDRARRLEAERRENAQKKGSGKGKEEMATMVRVGEKDGQKVISMVDNTNPLIDIGEDELPGAPPSYQASIAASQGKATSSSSSAAPLLLDSLLDEDVRAIDQQLEKMRLMESPEPKSRIGMLELRRQSNGSSPIPALQPTPSTNPAMANPRPAHSASAVAPPAAATSTPAEPQQRQALQSTSSVAPSFEMVGQPSRERVPRHEPAPEPEEELEEEEEEEDSDDGELQMMHAEPIDDYLEPEPQVQSVQLGEPGRDINITWDGRQ